MKEMKHIRLVLLAVLLGCITLGIRLASGREDAPPARQPADILSFHGAPWLERLERVEMEKPEAVLDALNIRPGNVVADVGAGSGFFTVRLARRVGKEGKVYAVDIQQEMLDLIREKIGRMKLTNVEPVLGETADPKLPPAIVDLVFIVDAYHEFQKPIALMRRLREALKPSGRVMIIEYKADYEYIRVLHKMEESQIVGELKLAGLVLARRFDMLEHQHMLIFKKSNSGAAERPETRR